MTRPVPEFRPPPDFLEIARELEARGCEAWAVGGAVRDELLGRHRADWDLATDARPEEVRQAFRRTVPIGIEHGTVGVLAADGTMYEVTTFRRDIQTDGRHAVVEFAERIEDDLARRDFTINALAWRPATGELRDPFDGRLDLERRVLRAVGEPEERFAEDYLRVLRGLRFAGRLSLEVEPGTREALVAAASQLGRLSAERVREELIKVLRDDRPAAALALYAEVGALEPWYPEVSRVADRPDWQSNLAAVEAIPAARPLLRLVRWLLPIAPEPEERAALGRTLLERLRFSNAETKRVVHLLRHAPPAIGPADSAATIREWLADVGPAPARDAFRVAFAGVRAAGEAEGPRYLIAAWRRAHDELLGAPPLRLSDLAIDGDDLLRLGVRRGPAVGILLDELHAEVLEDPEQNEHEALLERARELIAIGHLGGGTDGTHGGSAGGAGEPSSGGATAPGTGDA